MRWFLFVFLFLSCVFTNDTQIVIDPIFERSSLEVLHPHVDKVILSKDSTLVYCSINCGDNLNYSIPKTMYIENLKTSDKYQIIRCEGLPFEPEVRQIGLGSNTQILFIFPHIDDLCNFNIIEDPLEERIFNIYGINLSESYSEKYDMDDFRRFNNMSDFFQSSNDNTKYLEFEEKELGAAQYIYGTRSLAASNCYSQLSKLHNRLGHFSRAIDLGIQTLKCDSIQFGIENSEKPVYVYNLGSLSQFYLNAGRDTEALQCIQKCIRIWRNIENEEGYINEISNLLLTCRDSASITKGIEIVQKELKNLPIFIKESSTSIAIIEKQLATSYSLIEDYSNAIICCDKALALLNSVEDTNSEVYAELLSQKCKWQQMIGQYKESISTGETAKQLYERLNINSYKYAELLGYLAWTYCLVYNYEKSIQLQRKVAQIYEDAKDWISMAEAYNQISQLYQSAEDLDNAEMFIKKAIVVLDNHDDVRQNLYKEIELTGNTDLDNPFALASIKQRINYNKSNFRQTLARIYQKEGKLLDAIRTEKENGLLLNDIGDMQLYAISLGTLSQYYFENKQYSNALICAEQGLKILSSSDKKILAPLKMQLAAICYETGNVEKGIQYAKESVSLSEQLGNDDSKIIAQSFLSFFYWKNNEIPKAEECLSDLLDHLKNKIGNELVEMTSEQKQRMWSKYDTFFQMYRNVIADSDRNGLFLSKLYDYILFSKGLLLDSEIINNSIHKRFRLNLSWKDVQKKLNDNDVAIEFFATRGEAGVGNTYHALVIDRKCHSPQMITLFSESTIEKQRRLNNSYYNDSFGDLIWEPIISNFRKAENIYFSPDGILHILPIEYYKVNNIGFMYEQYNMYRLSSTKELSKGGNANRLTKAILYGGLDYNSKGNVKQEAGKYNKNSLMRGIIERGGFDPLYNTLLETQEIKEMLVKRRIPTTLFSGASGTEESFKKLSNQGVSMIHLATHGMYISPEHIATKKQESNFNFLESLTNEKNPVKEDVSLTHSFLVMSGGNKLIHRDTQKHGEDGILTAQEISKMKLNGLDLVVLSACESAQGDLETGGVYGLQRGFKKAGAKTIIMSLEKVDDEATHILMVEFYKNLMAGKSKHQSLKDAQQYLRSVENGKYDKPEYWASFIMLDGLD